MNPRDPSPRAGDRLDRPHGHPSDGTFADAERETATGFGPDFWAAVEPPQPTDRDWRRVRDAIRARLSTRTPGGRRLPPAAAAVLLAAGLTAAAWLIVRQADPGTPAVAGAGPTPGPRMSADGRPDREKLALAGPADVTIESVQGSGAGGFVGVEPPLPGRLTLASAADVRVESPDAVALTAGSDDAPMIFAAARTP